MQQQLKEMRRGSTSSVSTIVSSGDETTSCERRLSDITSIGEKIGTNDIIRSDQKDVDEILARTLNKLTFQEREEINEEIHGINVSQGFFQQTGSNEEPTELVEDSLRKINDELETIRRNDSMGLAKAFDHSQRLYGSRQDVGTYLNSRELRLMMLRADKFDCQQAAERLCRFANLMYELLGDLALQRFFTFADLPRHDQEYLRTGGTQMLPRRDRAGRRVYVHFCSDNDFPTVTDSEELCRARMRISAYIVLSALRADVSVQRDGMIIIFYTHFARFSVPDFMLRGRTHPRLADALPLRIGAGHYCLGVADYGPMSGVLYNLSRKVLPHIRLHSGSLVECSYILQSFGIPSGAIPLNSTTGEIDLTYHTKWLELSIAREDPEEGDVLRKRIIECPYHSDILFGRGQIVMKHPGNTMFRNLVQTKLEEYSRVKSKKESTQLTWEVVRILKKNHGARFLKESSTGGTTLGWVEVSNDDARSKVRIAFRDARSRLASGKATSGKRKMSSKKQNRGEDMKEITSAETDGRILPNPALSSAIQPLSLEEESDLMRQQISPMENIDLEKFTETMFQDSSTAAFLGMDHMDTPKRPRLCSHNLFDCL